MDISDIIIILTDGVNNRETSAYGSILDRYFLFLTFFIPFYLLFVWKPKLIYFRVHADTTVFAVGVSTGTDEGNINELASFIEGVKTSYYTPEWSEILNILSNLTLATCLRTLLLIQYISFYIMRLLIKLYSNSGNEMWGRLSRSVRVSTVLHLPRQLW